MKPMSRYLGAVALLAATSSWGCSSDSKDEAADVPGGGLLDLQAPANGVQIQTEGLMIPAGADQEFCEVVEIPGIREPSTT
jgi:uncharacterized phage protein gp47/JayE